MKINAAGLKDRAAAEALVARGENKAAEAAEAENEILKIVEAIINKQ